MIRLLDGFPDNVVAASVSGRLTKADYDTVLIPRLEAVAKAYSKIRCYFEIGPEFSGMAPGAIWDDLKIGVEYWTRWDRVAVVTDVTWIAQALKVFGFLMPGRIRVFPTSDKQAARAWVEAP